jgi:hypothetical protein
VPVPAGSTGFGDALATPEELADLPGMAGLDEATAEALLGIATAVVQALTGQRIVTVEGDSLDILGTTESSLWLPQGPVTAVTSVELDGEPVADWKRFGVRLWRSCGWAPCAYEPSTVTVVYSHGYGPNDQGIQLAKSAALMLAAGAAKGSPGVTSESIDDYQVVYEKMAGRMEASPFLVSALCKAYERRVGLVRVG